MEIFREQNIESIIIKLIQKYCPYQKVVLIYDFSFPAVMLDKLEQITKNNIILTKHIFCDNIDINIVNQDINDGSRMVIFCMQGENYLKIFKNLALDNITKVCLPTDCDILGFVVNKSFCVDKNNILVICEELFEYNNYYCTNGIISLCCLLTNCIYSKWHAYMNTDSHLLMNINDIFNKIKKELTNILNSTNASEQSALITNAICEFWEKNCSILTLYNLDIVSKNNLPYYNVLNSCLINVLAIMNLLKGRKQRTLTILDVYKEVKTTTGYQFEQLNKYFDMIFDAKANYILTCYAPTLIYDCEIASDLINKTITYFSIKEPQINVCFSQKNIIVMLKTIKKYLKNLVDDNIIKYTYLYNTYQKVPD